MDSNTTIKDIKPVNTTTETSLELNNNNNNSEEAASDNNTSTTTTDETPKLSKNQQKRLIKQQRWEEFKDKKKVFLREKKKENKKKRKENMSAEERLEFNKLRQLKKRDVTQLEYFGNVLFDFEMYDKMAEKEKKSLITQMCFLHGVNKISEKPVHLHATGITEEIKQALDKACPFKMLQCYSEPYIEKFSKDELVYLTSESPNVITELDPNKKYIIGAIVDHNRLKGITFEKANTQGIATAQLPIGEFIQMASRKVLAVNHVFQILNQFLICNNWKDAFEKVIPKRKFEEGKKKRKKYSNNDNDQENEDDEDESDGDEENEDDEEELIENNENKESNNNNSSNNNNNNNNNQNVNNNESNDNINNNESTSNDEQTLKKIKLDN